MSLTKSGRCCFWLGGKNPFDLDMLSEAWVRKPYGRDLQHFDCNLVPTTFLVLSSDSSSWEAEHPGFPGILHEAGPSNQEHQGWRAWNQDCTQN